MYWIKTPTFIQKALPQLVWCMPTTNHGVYLTFDDGPVPEVTEFVINELDKAKAKATFFCVGKNVERHSDIYQELLDNGHSIGNHSYSHLNGWLSSTGEYIENISQAAGLIDSNLFRPPYGRITPAQWSGLLPNYKIIMWDVLPGDFDHTISPEKCLNNAITHISPGSIVVLHDSVKARKNLYYVLPRLLNHLNEKGYNFQTL